MRPEVKTVQRVVVKADKVYRVDVTRTPRRMHLPSAQEIRSVVIMDRSKEFWQRRTRSTAHVLTGYPRHAFTLYPRDLVSRYIRPVLKGEPYGDAVASQATLSGHLLSSCCNHFKPGFSSPCTRGTRERLRRCSNRARDDPLAKATRGRFAFSSGLTDHVSTLILRLFNAGGTFDSDSRHF